MIFLPFYMQQNPYKCWNIFTWLLCFEQHDVWTKLKNQINSKDYRLKWLVFVMICDDFVFANVRALITQHCVQFLIRNDKLSKNNGNKSCNIYNQYIVEFNL